MENCEKILEGIEDPLIVISDKKDLLYSNQAAKQLQSILGKEKFKELIEKTLSVKQIEKRTSVKGIFVEIEDFKFLIDAFPYQEVGFTLLVRDITRFLELEELSKKEGVIVTITKLLSSIFHDMKGPVGGIKGAVQLLKEDPEDTELLEDILYEVKRLENMISEITFITKPLRLHKKYTNIHEILEKAIKSLKNTYKEIDFERLYDPSIPDVYIDRDYMLRVFINIIRNGIEAVGEKGKISISTGISWDKVHSPTGNKIFIKIKDSGEGVPEDMIDKLFLPFTSRKKNGMGIGLSSSYKIVKEHNGILRYVGDATFEILLPIKGEK